MDQLKQAWGNVINSQNPVEEAERVEALRAYLADASIPFRATIIDAEGNEIAYSDLTEEHEIEAVRLTFFTGEGEYQAPEWSPHDVDNFYSLFLE